MEPAVFMEKVVDVQRKNNKPDDSGFGYGNNDGYENRHTRCHNVGWGNGRDWGNGTGNRLLEGNGEGVGNTNGSERGDGYGQPD